MKAVITINRDRNVTKHDYETARVAKLLRVTNVFYTFQGEGPLTGWPSIFLRLAGCNIGSKEDCPWCDTKFDLESSHDEAVSDIRRHLSRWTQARVVVVTGGEPLLQWPTLLDFIKELASPMALLNRNPIWQLETNGLLLREEHLEESFGRHVMFVVSPKVPHNKGEHLPLPLWYLQHKASIALKYVVDANPLSPYYEVPPQAFSFAERGLPVYVSGMTAYKRPLAEGEVASLWDDTLVDREVTAANYAHAAHTALRYGLRVSYQTHLLGDVE